MTIIIPVLMITISTSILAYDVNPKNHLPLIIGLGNGIIFLLGIIALEIKDYLKKLENKS